MISRTLLLDNIRSSENVGSLFRTADAFGFTEIILVGITPTPVDKFGRENSKIVKTALGAEETVEWKQFKTPAQSIMYLKKKDVKIKIFALEQNKKSVSLKKQNESFALVVGNEITGVSDYFLKNVDKIFEIKMQGEKESLNVAVAAGIAMFALAG